MSPAIQRAGRIIEVFLGLFFVGAAAMKAVNMEAFAVQVSMYGVLKDPAWVNAAAYGALSVETLLGAAFLAGVRLRGLSFAGAGLLTLVFSGLIVYAWKYKGLEDCGCFGEYLSMTPLQSLLKNAALLGALGAGGYMARGPRTAGLAGAAAARVGYAAGVVGVCLVLSLGLVDALGAGEPSDTLVTVAGRDVKDRPFAKFQFETDGTHYDLGEGEYLVAMLSATCEHCQDSVADLNELSFIEELPPLLSLMLGTDDERAEFILLTEPVFPTRLIEALEFFSFVDPAPPRLIHVRDGKELQHWDWEEEVPGPEVILEALKAAG